MKGFYKMTKGAIVEVHVTAP